MHRSTSSTIGMLPLPDFLMVLLTFLSLTLTQSSVAVTPAPDGGYPNFNTAEGDNALFSLTTGSGNTANGNSALFNNTAGSANTAIGVQALYSNIDGFSNHALGHERAPQCCRRRFRAF